MIPVILLVGEKNAGKRVVASVLSNYNDLLKNAATNATTNNSTTTTSSVRALGKGILATTYDVHFDNKYYTASVQAWAVQTTPTAGKLSLPDNVVCQAIVGIFNGATASVPSTNKLLQQLQSMNDTLSPDVVALVATHGGANDKVNSCCEKCSWLEYLSTDALHKPLNTYEERNKEGLPRLYELLETVMWQSMSLKSRGGGGGGGGGSKATTNGNGSNRSLPSSETKSNTASNKPCCAFVSKSNSIGNNIASKVGNYVSMFNSWHSQLFPSGKVSITTNSSECQKPNIEQYNKNNPSTNVKLLRTGNIVKSWKYNITNKYYSAEVNVITHDLEEVEDVEVFAHDLRDANCEVLVGVAYVDSSNIADGDDDPTLQIRNALKNIKSTSGASTIFLMVVGENDGSNTSLLPPKIKQTCVDWCLENHAEIISIDNYMNEITTTFESRDKVGYARLHEALCSVQWSNSSFKQKPASTSSIRKVHAPSTSNVIATTNTITNTNTTNTNTTTSKTPPLSQPLAPSDPELNLNFDGADSEAFWDAMQSAISGGGSDQDVDDLSSLVSQARAVRKAGEQGTLTDEERHQAAMRVAMQLAAVMGLNEDDF